LDVHCSLAAEAIQLVTRIGRGEERRIGRGEERQKEGKERKPN